MGYYVSGYVTDPTGMPLENVKITFDKRNIKYTDSLGYFNYCNQKPFVFPFQMFYSHLSIAFEKDEYETQKARFSDTWINDTLRIVLNKSNCKKRRISTLPKR